jgi:predicted exporter
MRRLRAAIKSNWKTTTIGLITASSSYITMFPDGFNQGLVNFSRFVQVGGLACLGIVSKDFDKTNARNDIEQP